MAAPELSAHDKAILNCIFNPNLPLEEPTEPITLEDFDEDDSPEVTQIKNEEIQAVELAENGNLDQALIMLNQSLKRAPKKASLYNNRAQVYQFLKKFEDAFTDLTTAIEMADKDREKKTLAHALCQRGLLHRRSSRLDEARDDFEVASKLGSEFAKKQLVELNPYAALCNQMLRKVMENV